jgi:hypothetical protein
MEGIGDLVPAERLLRKIDKVIDFEFIHFVCCGVRGLIMEIEKQSPDQKARTLSAV